MPTIINNNLLFKFFLRILEETFQTQLMKLNKFQLRTLKVS